MKTISMCFVWCTLASGPAGAQFAQLGVEVIHTAGGVQNFDQFGLAPAAVGDVTGDGVTEIACNAPGRSNPSGTTGACFLYDGATGVLIRTHPSPGFDVVFQRAAEVGDVNADGVPDYAAAGWNTGSNGTVFVFSGADGSTVLTLNGLTTSEQFGLGLASPGDVNADGHADVLVGAPFHKPGAQRTGRVAMYSGADGTELWSALGAVAHDAFGHNCFPVDDYNADGVRDVAVGAPQMRPNFANTGPGYVLLLSGATGAPIGDPLTSPSATSAEFGSWIPSPTVDLNGDGAHEIVISDQFDFALGQETGRAVVFDGATREVLYEIVGSSALQGTGATGNAGDFDGDGLDDLIVTDWRSPDGAPGFTGKVRVVRGTDGAPIGTVTSTSPGGAFGGWTFGMGDVDADGMPDIFVNAPWLTGDGPQHGRFWVLSGRSFLVCGIDFTGDGALNIDDIEVFVANFLASSPLADLNADEVLTTDDIDIFVGAFLAGCG
ncbi:MAG: hypothetical protein DHS20C14_01230 [Phycisphaeraceae bacterium]|nr:MAG: hypothetical protein DHS20C14_01230 [Phycisphaeraceae bacterium]